MSERKFRHKKTGQEYILCGHQYIVISRGGMSYRFRIPKEIVENSNDWQEITEQNFTITEFKSTYNDDVFRLFRDNLYTGKYVSRPLEMSHVLNTGRSVRGGDYKISSVRLKDGTEIKLGDYVTVETGLEGNNMITSCFLREFKTTDFEKASDLAIKLTISEKDWTPVAEIPLKLNYKISVVKEKLFVSKDGYDIFEGDEVYDINSIKMFADKTFIQSVAIAIPLFKLKCKADSYRMRNEKKFSLEDVDMAFKIAGYEKSIGSPLYNSLINNLIRL